MYIYHLCLSVGAPLVQQKQYVEAVRCRKFFSGLSACLFLIFCKYLVCALHVLATTGYCSATKTNDWG